MGRARYWPLMLALSWAGCDDGSLAADAGRLDATPSDAAAVDAGEPPPDVAPADGRADRPDAIVDGEMPDAAARADAGPPDARLPDLGAPDAMAPQGDGCTVLPLLEQSCATGGCHLPHNPRTSLVLTHEATAAGALAGYIVPGDPDASYLIERMRGEGVGPLMPLGALSPIDGLPLVEAWIADGAPTHCDAPAAPAPQDPNHLDRDALFECVEPDAVATPARLRRVERREWTRAVVKPLSGTWWGSTARDNPLAAPDGLPYSTYPADVTVDPATLDLYLLVLPEAPALWNTRDPVRAIDGTIVGERTEIVYRNRPLWCVFDDAEPDDACLDLYVDTLLKHGVLFRTPTDGERDRLRAFLVQALADEADPGDRRLTLQYVGEAAFMMAGALFRPELGEPDPDQPGRWRLTADEMALAVARVLTAHPVGAPLPIGDQPEPDASNRLLGRMSLIRAAADDGSIFDRDVIAGLLEAYRGGVDEARVDLVGEVSDRDIPSRGEYWLAENIQQFFREWLDYEGAITIFKDTPGATSRWDGDFRGDPMYDPTTRGFRNLQDGFYGRESTLVDQLDDTIARAVIESHRDGDDVFARLMTTRTWRLPSNMADTIPVPCETSDTCPREPELPVGAQNRHCTALGLCGSSIAGNTVTQTRVYDIDENVPATQDGRWVDVPADERAGVLTHPAWLAAHGRNFEDDASAVHRGLWIRERLFCESVPGLELVQAEAQLVPSDPAHSARERLRLSVEDLESNPQAPVCMGCHGLMNSLGYPFEIYNHAGFRRDFDHGPDGPVPPSGYSRIAFAPEAALDVEVADAVELAELLAESRVARRCFIRQVFRYFMGRDETLADACLLAEMEAALDGDGSFFSMLEVLVASEGFSARVPPQEAP